jgi:NADH-quinone oxidoreductase subunit B
MSFFVTQIDRLLAWSRANSLAYFAVSGGCCADEVLQTFSCRYDLERFGCVPQVDPRHADLLIVSGAVTRRMGEELRAIYDQMLFPKYVMAIRLVTRASLN